MLKRSLAQSRPLHRGMAFGVGLVIALQLLVLKWSSTGLPPPTTNEASWPASPRPRPSQRFDDDMCAKRSILLATCSDQRSVDHLDFLSYFRKAYPKTPLEVKRVLLSKDASINVLNEMDFSDKCSLVMVVGQTTSCPSNDVLLDYAIEQRTKYPKLIVPKNVMNSYENQVGYFAEEIVSMVSNGVVRPILFKRDMGEMFHLSQGRFRSLNKVDFGMDRGLWEPHDRLKGGTLIHFLNGYDFVNCPQYVRPNDGETWIEGVKQPIGFDPRAELESKKGFIATVSGSVWKAPYAGDHFLRVWFCWKLNKINPHSCHSPSGRGGTHLMFFNSTLQPNGKGCPGKPVDSGPCYRPYKFLLTAENTIFKGHITEKPLLAGRAYNVPVYFGAPDYEDFNLNPKRMIVCDVPKKLVDDIRDYNADEFMRPRVKILSEQKRHTHEDREEFRKTAQDIMEHVDEKVGTTFDPCMKRLFEIHENDALYLKKLSEPLFVNNDFSKSHWDGFKPAQGLASWLSRAGLPEWCNPKVFECPEPFVRPKL